MATLISTSSTFRGVRRSGTKTWTAQISVSGSTRQLGLYESEVDAAKAYDKAAKELHDAPTLNFREDGTLNPDRKGPRPAGASGFRGVSWIQAKRRWRAQLSVKGRRHILGEFTDEVTAAREYDRAVRRLNLKRPVNLTASADDTDDGPGGHVVSTCGSGDDGDSIWDSDDADVVEDEDEEDDDGDDDDDDSGFFDEVGLQRTESPLQPTLKRSRTDDPATVAHQSASITATVPVPSTQDPLKQLQEVVTAAMVQARDKAHVERQRIAAAFAVIFKRHMQNEIRDFAERTITNSFVTMDIRCTQDRELLLQMFIAAFVDSS